MDSSPPVRAARLEDAAAIARIYSEGIADRSIKPCDAKLAAFAIAGSLNWIGHWFQPDGALSADAIADEFSVRLTEGLATKPIRQGRNQHP